MLKSPLRSGFLGIVLGILAATSLDEGVGPLSPHLVVKRSHTHLFPGYLCFLEAADDNGLHLYASHSVLRLYWILLAVQNQSLLVRSLAPYAREQDRRVYFTASSMSRCSCSFAMVRGREVLIAIFCALICCVSTIGVCAAEPVAAVSFSRLSRPIQSIYYCNLKVVQRWA